MFYHRITINKASVDRTGSEYPVDRGLQIFNSRFSGIFYVSCRKMVSSLFSNT